MAGLYPAPTNYITTVGEDGISRFHSSKTPTSIDPIPSFRVHYIYSTTNTPAGGPPVKDNADLKNYEEIAAVPQVHFPTAGGTGGCLIHFAPNPEQEKGVMHTTTTVDYIFIIDGEMELGLDNGETRLLKKGDTAVQRASAHWWRNPSKTEPAIMAAVSVGIEGAVENEMRIQSPPEEEKEKGE
ncbi:hypothetical protein V495_04382 [Pseudogymnoascus sp. VKM F-4514 (FW-929)]|nr:hypothetical protein V490_07081 [Pseudogymnoascus sp. VKM F-3557]KFY42687.1 hypothetical protein V495_04382 [Pseudogymnoascus sp. VKM F-4514 (FW-929)]KFY54005.1 hypothetical protein V497_08042 [Pseudogymnoascus sp. VKM F-4516 (FW-969)]